VLIFQSETVSVLQGNALNSFVTNDLLTHLIEYRRHLQLADFPSINDNNIPLVANLKYKNNIQPITDSMLYKLIKTTCIDIANNLKLIDPASAFIIEKVSTHWLRHTSATHQVDAGIDIRVVKENLRHSMLETTMKYQHTEANARHIETNKKFGIK
jgi:integrase